MDMNSSLSIEVLNNEYQRTYAWLSLRMLKANAGRQRLLSVKSRFAYELHQVKDVL